MYELSLFTGAGGGILGTMLAGHIPIGYVEWNPYCQRIIAARIRDGILPAAPIFTDVRKFILSSAAEQYRGIAGLVTAGFPCQPFSVAGKQLADLDGRNMWPATADVIRIVRPESVLLENVAGLISTSYFRVVIGDLAAMGYSVRWAVLGASDVGAPHRRKRVWIVADAERLRSQRGGDEWQTERSIRLCGGAGSDKAQDLLADSNSKRRQGGPARRQNATDVRESPGREGRRHWWKVEPDVGRVANGVAHRVDRLKALGNGQVPLVAATAWEILRLKDQDNAL